MRVGGVSVDGVCPCLSKGYGVMETAGNHEALDWGGVTWRRAAACSESSCVEVASLDEVIGVRDSKRPDQEPLVFSHAEWEAFRRGVAAGDFDHV